MLYTDRLPLTGCNEFIQFDAGNLELNDTGRILQLDVNLLNVCPDRRVALAVILTELDPNNEIQPRGMKTFVIPPHGCQLVQMCLFHAYSSFCRTMALDFVQNVLSELSL